MLLVRILFSFWSCTLCTTADTACNALYCVVCLTLSLSDLHILLFQLFLVSLETFPCSLLLAVTLCQVHVFRLLTVCSKKSMPYNTFTFLETFCTNLFHFNCTLFLYLSPVRPKLHFITSTDSKMQKCTRQQSVSCVNIVYLLMKILLTEIFFISKTPHFAQRRFYLNVLFISV